MAALSGFQKRLCTFAVGVAYRLNWYAVQVASYASFQRKLSQVHVASDMPPHCSAQPLWWQDAIEVFMDADLERKTFLKNRKAV